ncbi:predicted protein [Phaeodactylum tricornutum CCAP 1055/1]|uniref:SGNH hydrolase-type esterase domain-containing protein n=1 Tax=Phaeodactylum tricornutum (strain CCAP 1055/1) TaxID=556484 RepID=B7S3S6_PHATC|nr:predicted protein [Phaeodactylum tricornutum CCAP 1055/1]XP_002176245.1 predicted protein [Phaeodactylum tricornutum CCAP 1055/1]EEC42764.1 predicted protein [Phaeodactylum tricornutum CCAP 1055/1]EEC42794.1 predicted protein [Phaeodactylum tricornutum CCAP 1055/1]|eukprot:XP_002176216.1 predicted protein [Phaeodactylum tricornutum CCAP 1055/1]
MSNQAGKSAMQTGDEEDSDLTDLLQNQMGGSNTTSGTETARFNLDHLTQGKMSLSPRNTSSKKAAFLDVASSYISMLCHYYPGLCGFFVFLGIAATLALLSNLFFNPTENLGVIKHDHSNIKSVYDVKMGQIDHWCLKGDNDSCRCEDPLNPISRADHKSWVQAFKANRRLVKEFQDPIKAATLDVAFLGESVIEEMDGRWMGRNRSAGLGNIGKTFKAHFSKQKGGTLEGVALGIAGDTAPNVLWRLMHGEMTDYFNPKVWWIGLGMNDLSRMQCSEEVVVLGILRVVEEILEKKPNARIVINSLLPMVSARSGAYPIISDYQDSLAANSTVTRKKRSGTANAAFTVPVENRLLKSKDKEKEVVRPKRAPTEEEKDAAAQEEEEARDKAARRKRKKIVRKQKDPVNPIMKDRQRIKKYTPGTLHLRQNKIPLWNSVRAINAQLRKFAGKQDRVSFFDATDIFATREDGQRYVLQSDRISARGHPTNRGYMLWEDAIVKRLDDVLTKMRRDQPDLFSIPTFQNDDDSMDITQETGDGYSAEGDDFEDDAFGYQEDDFIAENREVDSENTGSSEFAPPKDGGVPDSMDDERSDDV